MGTESSSTAGAPQGISRRRVVAGAAWSVPAIMVASAAPAMAASPCLTASFGGQSCKYPGGPQGYGYELQICFTNDCTSDVTVHITSIKGKAASSPLQNVNQDLVVPADGQQYCLPGLVTYCSANSGNYIDIVWNVVGQPSQTSELPSPVQECTGTSSCPPK